jgi:HEAT repeat protein
MGLKKRSDADAEPKERRFRDRDKDGLLVQLKDSDPVARRWAAHDLAEFSDVGQALLDQLSVEHEQPVQSALLTSLVKHPNMVVVRGLVRLLRCEDAWLRNAVIEALALLPLEVAAVVEELLRDEDSDVRIMAASLLTALPHPSVPGWLLRLATQDEHPNVVTSALEGLVECATPDMVGDLERLKARFRALPFVVFAVDLVLGRARRPR